MKSAWADPIFGMRAAFAASDRLSVKCLAEVVSFGAASDITYQLMTTVSHAFTDPISADLGYRYLRVDHEDEGLFLDAKSQGSIVRLVFRF